MLKITTALQRQIKRPLNYINTQQEFCFFACSVWDTLATSPRDKKKRAEKVKTQSSSKKRKEKKAKGRGSHTVKHFALSAQPIALGHQIINLLSSLQHALNRLVQHNLGLVQLLLDLHDAVGLLRVLVLGEVVRQLGEGQDDVALSP